MVKPDLLLWNIQPCLLGCYTDNLCLETLQLWVMVFSYWITCVCETKQTSTVEVWLTCFESPKSFVCLRLFLELEKCFRPDVLDQVSFNRPPAHNPFNPLFTSSCQSWCFLPQVQEGSNTRWVQIEWQTPDYHQRYQQPLWYDSGLFCFSTYFLKSKASRSCGNRWMCPWQTEDKLLHIRKHNIAHEGPCKVLMLSQESNHRT